ncbi:cadherin-like domain-containing protein [Primorskyibacter sp. 2E233]|uniref:cadherin-like domain-containing protein n=1 Tax=Primorskyibacter sp. 2E233 TaxID=3413431 RepID=UPI003BF3DB3D
MFASDDFYGGLSGSWQVITPTGTTQSLGTQGDEAYLSLSTGSGTHDIWGATNDTVRTMQFLADADFSLEARFLSTPTGKYQMQGFLIESDASNWMRFDTYSDGSKLYAFAAVTLNGTSSMAFKVAIPEGTAPFLRLARVGDTYTLSYSQDGETWTVAGSLTEGMEVTSGGVYAGSTGGAGNFTALVDYIEISSDPIVSEDGVQSAPVAQDDALTTAADAALLITAADLVGNDTDADGDTLSVASVGTPTYGTVTDNGDGTFTYTPTAGYNGYDSFDYTVDDGTGRQGSATVTLTVGTPPLPKFESDDFADPMLNPDWDVTAPAGTTWELTGTATDGFLQMQTGSGNFDLWDNTRNALTALQTVTDEDFTLEVKYLATPDQKHQMQGFLIEEDDSNWMRFDLYSDGSKLYAMAAITVDGTTQLAFKTNIPSEDATYLRLERVGDTFVLEYSSDGESWTTAGTVTHGLTVSKAGLFAGSVGTDAALTVQVDYVELGNDPILDEDGTYFPEPAAPVVADDALDTPPDQPIVFTAAELLANDWDINSDTLTIVGFSDPGHGVITDQGNGTYLFTPEAGYEGVDSFTYTVSDGGFTTEGNVSVIIDTFNAVSDDFAGGALDPVWNFYGIVGDAKIGYLGTDAVAAISSPAGVPVSASDVITTPRMLQDVYDIDFQISAGFLSEPSQKYQEHGLLVVADDGNWIRFDLAYTTKGLTLIVGSIEDGSTDYLLFMPVDPGEVEEFRITRDGDQFIFEYRGGGSDWTTAYVLDRDMAVTQVGTFAGSAPFGGIAPGYTAYLDYFENSLDPIVGEDTGYTPQNYAPEAMDDTIHAPGELTFDSSSLTGNDYDPNLDDPLSVVSVGTVSDGTLTDNGDGTFTYTPDPGFYGIATFDYVVSDGLLTDSATVSIDVREYIDVWYGDVQTFGTPGVAQEFINILGSVDGAVIDLSYSLNGGPAVPLSIGPDTRRLNDVGDFNIDIPYDLLDGSPTDDIVTITATLSDGSLETRDVVVEYEEGASWDPNYSIDWSTVTDIQEVVQVVDGTWAFTDAGVRPVDLGYDRLLVLGDDSWDNYQLETTITMHDLTNVDPRGRDGGAFAIGMLWGGHTDDPVSGWQPTSGWNPGASFFYTDELESHSYHDFSNVLGRQGFQLEEGLTYNVVVSVTQTGIYDRVYSLKIWEVGTEEPIGWTLQTVETFSIDEAPATGGIYLNAHYYDVTFGDIEVTEITGSDIVNGTDGNDLLSAADDTQPYPGAGEIDVFTGGAGADTFVMGDSTVVYYDDGVTGNQGLADYAFVWDFNAAEDAIQLNGTLADYELREDVAGLTPGTSIWLVEGGEDELIGVLNNVYGLSLAGDEFVYVSDLPVA